MPADTLRFQKTILEDGEHVYTECKKAGWKEWCPIVVGESAQKISRKAGLQDVPGALHSNWKEWCLIVVGESAQKIMNKHDRRYSYLYLSRSGREKSR